jgi:hypothetical protein
MSKVENIDKYILLDNLFNVFLEIKYQPEDDVEFKKENGVDIEPIVQKNIKLFRQLNTQAKAELNKVKHDRVLEFLSKVKTGIASGIQEYKNIADEILSVPRVAEMYRNLEEVTENDKNSLLLDSKLLDMLSDIEEEYNKQSK